MKPAHAGDGCDATAFSNDQGERRSQGLLFTIDAWPAYSCRINLCILTPDKVNGSGELSAYR
jgi:hypothetical protein